MPDVTVLVVTADPSIAQLVGTMVELTGCAARYPRANEPVAAAIARARPRLVIIDMENALVLADSLLKPLRAAGTSVLLFSPSRDQADIRQHAEALSLPWFAFPIDRHAFAQAATRALEDQ